MPPDASTTCPVTHRASGEARNATTSAIAAPIPRAAPVTSATFPSSFFMVPILSGCSMFCVSQGPDPVFKPLCLHHHHLAVVGAERNSRHTLKGGEEMDREFS